MRSRLEIDEVKIAFAITWEREKARDPLSQAAIIAKTCVSILSWVTETGTPEFARMVDDHLSKVRGHVSGKMWQDWLLNASQQQTSGPGGEA